MHVGQAREIAGCLLAVVSRGKGRCLATSALSAIRAVPRPRALQELTAQSLRFLRRVVICPQTYYITRTWFLRLRQTKRSS